jgi:ribulose kinase
MLDRTGAPVTVSTTGDDAWNVVMWADHRATTEASEMTATRHRVLDHVGGLMSPEMELPKLLWLKRHLPDAWQRYGLAFDLTDFLTWKATGAIAVSACTVTCKWTYLNHEKPGWQQDFLSQIGLAELQPKLALPGRQHGSQWPHRPSESCVAEILRPSLPRVSPHARAARGPDMPAMSKGPS